MKMIMWAAICGLAMTAAGCGSTVDSTASKTLSDSEVAGIVMTGSGLSSDSAVDETESDLNAAMTEAVSQKVQEELDAMLETEEYQAALEDADANADLSKDVRVGLSIKGLTVFIEDEEIPFAGGKMILNGDVGLKLRFKPGYKIEVVASGMMNAALEDVQRTGLVEGFPYELSLNGSNKMSLDGVFSVTVKSWKISAMGANLESKIVESNVVAKGAIAGKEVSGTVNMMDVGLSITNPDILKNPKAFAIKCTGSIETKINDDTIGLCELAETCLSCK